ncbi:MAG: DUF2723 domain-containing protein [Planctomycetota bacterium]|nr:DUF2723 domain-containing protein [Planctomycetota bacterium]
MTCNHATDTDCTGEGGQVHLLTAALVFALAFALYVATCAPGVVWGDSAKLATMTSPLKLTVEAGCHTLRNAVGVVFNLVPIGDVAYRQNLMSAFFGALACALTFLLARRLTRVATGCRAGHHTTSDDTTGDEELTSVAAGVCAAAALAVSHIFWHLSVVTESYTLFVSLLAGIWLLLLRWREGGGAVNLRLAGILLGASYMNSVLMIGLTPAIVLFIWLHWRRRHEGAVVADASRAVGESPRTPQGARSPRLAPALAVFFAMIVLGYAPMICLFLGMLRTETFSSLIGLTFDWRYSGSLFVRQPLTCAKECAKYAAFLFYQFPIAGFVLGCTGIVVSARRDWRTFVSLVLTFLPIVLFTSTYMEQRRYFIMVGSFWVFALWSGFGAAWALERAARAGRGARRAMLLATVMTVAVAAIPVALYYNVLRICAWSGVKPGFGARRLVYRDNERFFLVPDKRGDYGAERFAREAFAVVPDGAIIVADFTPGAVLNYFQSVRGVRPDVAVVPLEGRSIVEYIDRKVSSTPLFIVGDHPAYKEDDIRVRYDLLRVGPLYQVVPKVR